ncbi:MAG: carbohydrate kinase family protein [bacterium]
MPGTTLVGFSTNIEVTAIGYKNDPLMQKQQLDVGVPGRGIHVIPAGSSFNLATVLHQAEQPVKLLYAVGSDFWAAILDGVFRERCIDAFPLSVRSSTNITISLYPEGDASHKVLAGKGEYVQEKKAGVIEIIRRQVQQVKPANVVGNGVQLADAPLVLAMFQESTSLEKPSLTVLNPGASLLRSNNGSENATRVDILTSLLGLTQLLVVNQEEMGFLLRGLGLQDISALKAQTQADVIVTNGPQGAILYNGTSKPIPVQAHEGVRVVDPTGAGDCFLGSFLVGRNLGKDLYGALEYAAAAASLSIGMAGGSSVPNVNEVEEYLKVSLGQHCS